MTGHDITTTAFDPFHRDIISAPMLPYFAQPTWTVGRLTIHAFGLCAAAGLALGHWLILRRARRAGLDAGEIALYYMFLLVGGMAGLVLGYALIEPRLRTLYIVAGGVAGALTCFGVRPYFRAHAASYLDVTAFSAPFVAILIRLGCTLAHDHRGKASTGWLAFDFPEGSRYDLGFLELLFSIGLAGLFLGLDRRKRPRLLFTVTGIVLYAGWRLYLGTLEA